jgi:hypothetical protein
MILCTLIEFPMGKKNSELSISLSLGLKFTRSPSLNLAIDGVPTAVLRVCPNTSIIFSLDLNDFFSETIVQ